MGVIMSPQRGAIAALIRGEKSITLDHYREFSLEGAQDVFELGVNRDPTRRRTNPADVLVVGYDRPQEPAQNGFQQGYVVLLRDATEEEKKGWTAEPAKKRVTHGFNRGVATKPSSWPFLY